jgi:antitoxin YobK
MNTQRIDELLLQAGDDVYFVGEANDARILEIEDMLGLKLPNSYKWFLKTYGHGGTFGVEILGNGGGLIPSCVRATLNWRKYELPTYLVVVEDPGSDWIYCLDTSKMKNEECPVVDWEQNNGICKEFYDSFQKFFEWHLEESLSMRRKI